MVDNRLTYINKEGEKTKNDKVLNMVAVAIKDFSELRKRAPFNGSAIIAELTFGFWTTLFSKKYFEVLNRTPLYAFPARPRGTTWEVINTKLGRVRTFRNRVYHYEPLCFQKDPSTILCFQQMYDVHADIIELLAWISPDMAQWLTEIDLVPEKLENLRKKHPSAR